MVSLAIVIFFAIGIHEYCHCKFADMAGDPTPAFYGRVTLNLFKHFDPVGTVMIVISSLYGVGLGWGKPAPINPDKMRNPRWDTFIAVAVGPLSNLLQATIYAFFLRLSMSRGLVTLTDISNADNREQTQFLAAFLFLGIMVNLGLFAFNLIPFGILDGHWLVGQLLPDKPRHYWYKFNRSYGWQILVGLILLEQLAHIPILSLFISPIVFSFFHLLTGIR